MAIMTAIAASVAAMMARRRREREEGSVLACLDDFDSGAV